MKTWQFDLDGNAHTLVFDAEKSPPVVTLDGKPLSITPKLTKNGQAYGFMLHKHTGTIQTMQTEKGLRYGLVIDGQPVTPRPQPKADVAPLTQLPKYDTAGIFRNKQLRDEQRIQKKIFIRQIIPDWAWVAIIGIMFIPAFSQLQPVSLVLAGIGIVVVVGVANIPKMKEIHRFAFTIMVMLFCWSAFVILASRGIIKIDNLPLF
jgi:hypothetical protein